MLTLGVLSKARVFSHDAGIRYRSRAECEANLLNFELVQGQRFRQTMRLLRFDMETGTATPIDLSGSDLKFRAYKPKYDFELSITHEASGKTFTTKIALTEDESLILSHIASDEERQAYVNSLPAVESALKQLAVEAGLSKAS